jgi:hypothetical protein
MILQNDVGDITWASDPMERYIAECLLSNISQGLPWHTHPDHRVVRAKIIPEKDSIVKVLP